MASTFMSGFHLHGAAEGTTQSLLTNTNFPRDTFTILNRSLNVKLKKTVCCPTCYTLFFPPNLPSVCPYCETSRSKPCGTQVFAVKKLFVGRSHQGNFQPQQFQLKRGQAPLIEKPLCTFVWLELSNWLLWFLSILGIKSSIEDWCKKQGTAWKKLSIMNNKPNLSNKQQLVFSLFVDWDHTHEFMNLPPTMRRKIQYNFLAGINPGPSAPKMTTITHLIKPLVNELVAVNNKFTVLTNWYPGGQPVQVKLLPLIGNMGATHKVAGTTLLNSKRATTTWGKLTQDIKQLAYYGNPQRPGRYPTRNWCPLFRTQLDGITQSCHACCTWYDAQLDGRGAYVPLPRASGVQNPFIQRKTAQGRGSSSQCKAASIGCSRCRSGHDNYKLNQGSLGGLFSEREMDYFCGALKNMVLPLIASKWYILFVYVIPLIVSEIFKISFLIRCTHIVNTQQIRDTHGDCFKSSYESYNQSSVKILRFEGQLQSSLCTTCAGAAGAVGTNGWSCGMVRRAMYLEVTQHGNKQTASNFFRFRGWKSRILLG
ncbi:hypothetical protein VP01_1816g3 [Puccinia sorghi]|uniref:Uncharacterized protein n=1 Tax=Puccinia sorghi TaxID=27349 RepID=A0A0L6VE35_9BASI|nr:hypothetical protein VP01_1816g3 [Puccinia sorghi]